MALKQCKFPQLLIIVLIGLLSASVAVAGGGKISGTVIDAQTGEPIIGANVVLEGTSQGSATDIDGFFMIVNVQPGLFVLPLEKWLQPRRVDRRVVSVRRQHDVGLVQDLARRDDVAILAPVHNDPGKHEM